MSRSIKKVSNKKRIIKPKIRVFKIYKDCAFLLEDGRIVICTSRFKDGLKIFEVWGDIQQEGQFTLKFSTTSDTHIKALKRLRVPDSEGRDSFFWGRY